MSEIKLLHSHTNLYNSNISNSSSKGEFHYMDIGLPVESIKGFHRLRCDCHYTSKFSGVKADFNEH